MCAVVLAATACLAAPDRIGNTLPGEGEDAGVSVTPPPRAGPDAAAPEPSEPRNEPDSGAPTADAEPDAEPPAALCDPEFTVMVDTATPDTTLVAPDLPLSPLFTTYLVKNSGADPVDLLDTVVGQPNASGEVKNSESLIGDFRGITVIAMDVSSGTGTSYWQAKAKPGKPALEVNPPVFVPDGNQLSLPAASVFRLEVRGEMAVPKPAASAKPGEALSSDSPNLKLTGLTGKRGGKKVRACVKDEGTNLMVLRKSYPKVEFQQQPEKGLKDGAVNLYCFAAWPANKYPVGFKQFAFNLELQGPAGFILCDFFLMRNGVALASASITKVKSGDDLTKTCLTASGVVAAVTYNEQTVQPGQTTTFCLAAKATGVAGSSSVTTGFVQSSSEQLVKLCESKPPYFPTASPAPHAVVWSDVSELPHQGSSCPGASKDWYGAKYLRELDGAQKLAP